MDRNTLIATVLIALIMFVWLFYLAPTPPPPQDVPAMPDTLEAIPEPLPETAETPAPSPAEPVVVDSTIAGAAEGEERFITVETDLYEARLSTKGATITSFILKTYERSDHEAPVQLVDTSRAGAIALGFTTPANHLVDTRSFYFDTDVEQDRIVLTGDDEPVEVTFTATVGQGGQGRIVQTYRFIPETYEVDLVVTQENAASFSTRQGYELIWDGGIPFAEGSRVSEAQKAGAFVRSAGEMESITLMDSGTEEEEQTVRGTIDFVAVKNQYFTAVVMPPEHAEGAELYGIRSGAPDSPLVYEDYTVRVLMPAPQGASDAFTLYLGPMEYRRIAAFDKGLYDMVDYGWDLFEVITRPIARFVFIPFFSLTSKVIPNYGIIIILLAIFVKLLVYPLTKSSYTSMAKMRELQPKMEAIKEKYGDNPQKQQEAMLKMYKETGVNPLGGCLPMLLQYPVIIALWQFLPQSIQIRQQSFLWASDLSAPDVLLRLPFEIPFYGDFVAGFCLLMGLSMVVQMRIQMTPSSSNPQAKMMMYFMPVLLFVIFNQFASGLNLYYLCYNILSAVQQQFINKSIEKAKQGEEVEGGSDGAAPRRKRASNGQAKESKKGGVSRRKAKS